MKFNFWVLNSVWKVKKREKNPKKNRTKTFLRINFNVQLQKTQDSLLLLMCLPEFYDQFFLRAF